ncbi:hypothetical protein [Vagococcus fluvialis]|uniref:Uncharacterized protein n=1 Tax=Vagococcus fluvialis TaxID=2738 RepID=A0A369B1Y5_9ENTE|nr:hypothetical protein [Vagococcus fluvialis]RCX15670.1 hypothetical protein DFR54_1015 [Vagococcus fluvialis]RSU04437.1 hypothetical protein CBF32_03395 [Vagococcus fluvialis]WNF89118.1 hypothetical protein QDW48_08030 [Vagococcus fluvialis]
MSNIVDELLVLLKKKKTIAVIIIIVVGIVMMNVFKSLYRPTIREQQVDSVAKITYKNKQFKKIQDSELTDLLKKKEQQVIAVIDPSENKGYKKVEKMFNEKKSIENLPETVYIYEPVYPNQKMNKDLGINDKNTFIVYNEGKEIGRYSFNDLSVGPEEITTELNQIINPKIPRKKPVRKEVQTEDSATENTQTNNDGQTHTSEVFFE